MAPLHTTTLAGDAPAAGQRAPLFGLQVGPQIVAWEELRRWVLKAEALGFDAAWLADHFLWGSRHTGQPIVEMWSGLAALAAVTSRIHLGSLVASVTHRNPGITALSAATIDRISGGRFILGLGAGWNVQEHRAYGIPLPAAAVRMAMLDEAAQICRLLWTGDRVSFAGRHFQLDEAPCEITPVQQPLPLLIGAMGEQLGLRVVARRADIWNMVGGDSSDFVRRKGVLDRYCAEGGRDPASVRCSIEIPMAVATNPHTLERRIARVCRQRGLPREGVEERIIAGTPEQCSEKIHSYLRLGVDEFMLITLAPFDDDELECFAERVLPAFRTVAGGREDA